MAKTIKPNWPAPDWIEAYSTTVEPSSSDLRLTQTHSADVVEYSHTPAQADGIWTSEAGCACIVRTADCLPVLFTDGQHMAAVHAGWRGLANGILLETLKKVPFEGEIIVWIGPAISKPHFEVGNDVFQAFEAFGDARKAFFEPKNNQKYLADLAGLAEYQLKQQGLKSVYLSGECTYSDPKWPSYRQNQTQQRLYTVIQKLRETN